MLTWVDKHIIQDEGIRFIEGHKLRAQLVARAGRLGERVLAGAHEAAEIEGSK